MTAVMSYQPLDGPDLLPSSTTSEVNEELHTPWFSGTSLPYHDPYMHHGGPTSYEQTSYTATAATSAEGTALLPPKSVENSPWPAYSRPPLPEFVHGYATLPPPLSLVPSSFHHNRPPSSLENRPRSSPSTFGPGPDSINWPDPRVGLGVQYSLHEQQTPSAIPAHYNPGSFQPMLGNEIFNSPSPPDIKQPMPRRQYAPLAPNPAGTPDFNSKRPREEDEESTDASGKQRKRTSSVVSSAAELSEDDKLLVQLKEEEGLPWKDIAARFGSHHGKTFQVAALQMRYKRLREKFRVWQGEDVEALKLAYEYWEKYKWDIISSKMIDFGIQERWPPKHCARKWQKINPIYAGAGAGTPLSHPTPMMSHSQFSSPGESSPQYAYMPMS